MYKKHTLYLAFFCTIFFFIYSPFHLYFLSDDFDSIMFSLNPANLLHSFRPLSDASLYVDYSLWKMNASGFHLTNFILHFLSVFCFYFFSKSIFSLRNNGLASANMALTGSILFLFYPFHSEALFWIVGRGAVLCTLFGLLCFIFYLQKERNRWYYLISLVFFAASLLSYEEAWIIPSVITLLGWLYKKETIKRVALSTAGFWAVFLVYLTGRYFFTHDIIGTPYGSERMINFNVFLLCKNFVALIFRSLVIPMQSSLLFTITCAFTAVIAIGFFVFFRKKINLVLVVSAVCFLLSLIPVIPLGIDTHDTESERFLYFPSVFLLIFLVQFFSFIRLNKFWFVCIIGFIEGIGLESSYTSFASSSIVCQTTISALLKTGKTDTLFCSQLPGQYKGAFIFRNGFSNAVKLVKKDSVKAVIVLSRSELFHPEKNYKIEFIASAENIDKKPAAYTKNLYIQWKEDKITLRKQDK